MIRPEIAPGRRVIAISDIHGNLPFLKGVLAKAKFSPEDVLILVGDLFEKGKESLAELEFLLELRKTHTVYPLCGNCDHIDRVFLEGRPGIDEELWPVFQAWRERSLILQMAEKLGLILRQPGDLPGIRRAILQSFPEETQFLLTLPHILEAGRYIFVHGGISRETRLEELEAYPCMKDDDFLGQGLSFRKWVVVGHWPVTLYNRNIPVARPLICRDRHIVSIDGGCVLKLDGQLNALMIPDINEDAMDYVAYDGLPVVVAAEDQQASRDPINIRWSDSAIEVLREEGDWWQVAVTTDYFTDEEQTQTQHGEITGWLEHKYCLVNLPDVIPSIIYDATNSYSSHFRSCGKVIPEVTGEAFYPSKTYNERLGKMEFMMPVLYSMAFKLCEAQQSALAEGNSLILYEGYRPHEVQTKVLNSLSAMTRTDPEVKEAVTGAPWRISWFISGGYSNHQRGYAVDMGLAKVSETKEYTSGGYRYVRVWNYERYEMPTPIHELSRAAATYTAPVTINSTTAWKNAEMTQAMASNEPALGLQRYCTDAELTPLASECGTSTTCPPAARCLTTRASEIFSSPASEAPPPRNSI